MKFCTNCGTELKPEAKFCASCGTAVAVAATPPPAETTPPPPPPPPTPGPTTPTEETLGEQARQATQAFTDAVTGKTNILQRVINIISKPKEEWAIIATEKPDTLKLVAGYALILSLIPATCGFIRYGLIGYTVFGYHYQNIGMGFQTLLTQILSAVIGVFLLAYVIDLLAPSFESEKNFGRSLQLAVYATTPQWLAGIFLLFSLKGSIFMLLISLYAIYLLITGLPVLKGTPRDKVTGYTVLTIICMIAIGLILGIILGLILGVFFKGSMPGM